MYRSSLLFFFILVNWGVLRAQVKIGLWEPSYSGISQKSVYFNGDSIVSTPPSSNYADGHGQAVGYILLKGLANKARVYHAGFVPLTQHLKDAGIMDMTVPMRLKNLPGEYAYYSRFALTTVAWFRAQGARVVNMSFGTSATIFAENNQNLGYTDSERLTIAKQWMGHFIKSFDSAFRSAPDILFIVAAGNDGEDMQESFDVPALVDLPNVLCVGALGKDGRSIISNHGKRVDIYMPAEDMTWKDGQGLAHLGTGTSLAVPQITNKAVLLLTDRPTTTAAQLKAMLKQRFAPNGPK